MRRSIVVALGLLAACSNIPDDGTVDTCFFTIGYAEPVPGERLGSVDGWTSAAKQAIETAKHPKVRAAGERLAAALSPAVKAGGLTRDEIDAYAKAVAAFVKACTDSDAFKGKPAGRR